MAGHLKMGVVGGRSSMGKTQGFATPRRRHRQRQNDRIQTKTMHHLLPGGARGVAPPSGAPGQGSSARVG